MGFRDVFVFPKRVLGHFGACGIFLALILLPPILHAATFTVTNLSDSGAGSLRQAVLDANNAAGDDTIAFQSGLSGTILLSSQIVILSSNNLTINGPGASMLAISGNNTTRIFSISSSLTGSTITTNNLTLKNGRSSNGSAISSGGTVTINQCVLSNNVSTGGGGGISNSGTLTINSSILFGNSSSRGGGGISNSGTLIINNSTLSGNSDTSTTISLGGSVASQGTLTIANSTLSGNSSNTYGGGIYISRFSTATVSNSLVAGNISPTGKEIYISTGTFTSLGHNLFGENGATGLVNASPIASDLILAGAIGTAIGSLADNGGPTLTHLPVAGSPLIDAGNNSLAQSAGLTTDQRGAGFPRIVNGTVDIGAVEKASVCDPNIKLIPTPLKPVFGPTGGGGTLTVVIASQCPWTARSNVSWITLTGSKSGTGSGTVTFTISPNSTAGSRSGTITVAQKTATIFQRTGYQIDPPRPIPPKR